MCSESTICIDSSIFNEMISEIQCTRVHLEQSLNKSEKLLKKLYKLKKDSIKSVDKSNLLNNNYNDK